MRFGHILIGDGVGCQPRQFPHLRRIDVKVENDRNSPLKGLLGQPQAAFGPAPVDQHGIGGVHCVREEPLSIRGKAFSPIRKQKTLAVGPDKYLAARTRACAERPKALGVDPVGPEHGLDLVSRGIVTAPPPEGRFPS